MEICGKAELPQRNIGEIMVFYAVFVNAEEHSESTQKAVFHQEDFLP